MPVEGPEHGRQRHRERDHLQSHVADEVRSRRDDPDHPDEIIRDAEWSGRGKVIRPVSGELEPLKRFTTRCSKMFRQQFRVLAAR